MKNLLIILALLLASCASSETPSERPVHLTKGVKQGNPAKRGGTATVRKEHKVLADDPNTTNDERNDQPIGHYGSMTVLARNMSSGNEYVLDADVEQTEDGDVIQRLYFPKGGWVDFRGCLLDEEYIGECEDENGTFWEINGQKTQH